MVGAEHSSVAPKAGHRGSILMECLLAFPLILLFVSMILQFAHIWMARQMTAYAAFCATRAIMCVPDGEQATAAFNAAQMVTAWFSFVNLPGAVRSRTIDGSGSARKVHVGRLHGRTDLPDEESITYNDDLPYSSEVLIPGWGGIPGSDSAAIRTRVDVIQRGYENKDGLEKPYAAVRVVFKFPLLMPLVGRMVSYFSTRDREEDLDVGRYHLLRGWNGDETVLDEGGNLVSRSGARWGKDGRFPVLTLTETCMLPMPYSTARFPTGGYASGLLRGDGGTR